MSKETRQLPASGGSYTRKPDGSLEQARAPTAPAPSKAERKAAAKPAAPKKSTAKK